MAFVLDGSVALAWCFEDEGSEVADAALERLRTESAVVPGLWMLEVANALVVGERRKRVTAADARRAMGMLRGLPITVAESPTFEQAGETMSIARESGLSVYDAAYLELAIRTGSALATLDAQLLAAAKRAGVRVLG